MNNRNVAIITGASAGIGEATAYALAREGYNLSLCARRDSLLDAVARKCKANGVEVYTQAMDVTDDQSRRDFVQNTMRVHGRVDVLFNNAGLALGYDDLLHAQAEDVERMFDVNVFAVMEMTKLVLPIMLENDRGHVVFMGSIAGHQPYEKGSGYCASKHALRAMVESLQQELAASSVRFTSINPGMVETEFSVVRFKGDKATADAVYAGIDPLKGEDIAECVRWAISQPRHVNISEIHVFPVHQVDARKVVKLPGLTRLRQGYAGQAGGASPDTLRGSFRAEPRTGGPDHSSPARSDSAKASPDRRPGPPGAWVKISH